ncbi:MAG: hypoxanthine phosphoribosyltransferase [Victivallales bacterium]|nr:hypoxanthine phosphoribosyltransferase [Victivallales bacterium]
MKYSNPEVYISAVDIQNKIAELGRRISEDYKDGELTVVSISNGAMLFTADLVRAVTIPMHLDSIMISSYAGTESSGNISLRSEFKLDLSGKDVLIVDEILDSGNTLFYTRRKLLEQNPASLKICVLLNKQERRKVDVNADYVGFEIPDLFVIGYGMDYKEYFRNLPYIGIYKS